MAAPFSFVHRVLHFDLGIATGSTGPGGLSIAPPCESHSCVLVESRGKGTGYNDLGVASIWQESNFYEVRRGGNSGVLTVRVQLIDWDVGRQP